MKIHYDKFINCCTKDTFRWASDKSSPFFNKFFRCVAKFEHITTFRNTFRNYQNNKYTDIKGYKYDGEHSTHYLNAILTINEDETFSIEFHVNTRGKSMLTSETNYILQLSSKYTLDLINEMIKLNLLYMED